MLGPAAKAGPTVMCGRTIHIAEEETNDCEVDIVSLDLNAFDCKSQTSRFHHWIPKINAEKKEMSFFFFRKSSLIFRH